MAASAPRPAPCTLVIFGAAGDLTKRLLVPALYNLRRTKLLPEEFALVGIARTDKNTDSFRAELGAGLRDFAKDTIGSDDWRWLCERSTYLRGAFDDPATYQNLAAQLTQAGATGRNCLFYLATPPEAFDVVTRHLSASGLLNESDGWRRVIIEKPFGTDLASAQALNRELLRLMGETQIYRIDHYLGKETVQNLMIFRFGNGLFEPLWNREHIDHVQILVAETVTVEGRGKFYDATGALRDMVPNHLCQLLTLTAMEPPSCFGADNVRSEKTKVLEAAHPFGRRDPRHNAVRGQYIAGAVRGKLVDAYRDAPHVAADSSTETYVAMKVMIDNWRWAGVPFYIRTGKALAHRRTEIAIQFKQAPFAIFRDTPVERLTPNDLVLHIQPEEGVSLRFSAKVPGPSVNLGGVSMRFNYQDYFKTAPNTGYETLIYDCMMGDATLFQRADNIEAGWRLVQPVLDAWAEDGSEDLATYVAGSAGPSDAEALLLRDGRRWRPIDGKTTGLSS
jgi:glucose-6-phosphate 1-dehydrogenase